MELFLNSYLKITGYPFIPFGTFPNILFSLLQKWHHLSSSFILIWHTDKIRGFTHFYAFTFLGHLADAMSRCQPAYQEQFGV